MPTRPKAQQPNNSPPRGHAVADLAQPHPTFVIAGDFCNSATTTETAVLYSKSRLFCAARDAHRTACPESPRPASLQNAKPSAIHAPLPAPKPQPAGGTDFRPRKALQVRNGLSADCPWAAAQEANRIVSRRGWHGLSAAKRVARTLQSIGRLSVGVSPGGENRLLSQATTLVQPSPRADDQPAQLREQHPRRPSGSNQAVGPISSPAPPNFKKRTRRGWHGLSAAYGVASV